MNTHSQEVLQVALTLPEAERAEIAASLIRSLEEETDGDADAAWAAEIQRRVDAIDRGEVRLIPWDSVMQELRDRRHE
jgi:putative addiction module component (TIGR02574 family)